MSVDMENPNYAGMGNELRGKVASRFRELLDGGMPSEAAAEKACREFALGFLVPRPTLYGWSYKHSRPPYSRRHRLIARTGAQSRRVSALERAERNQQLRMECCAPKPPEQKTTIIAMLGVLSEAIDKLESRVGYLETELGVSK